MALNHKVICISLFEEDLQLLDRVVNELKEKGLKTNRSALLRHALKLVKVEDFNTPPNV